MLVLPESQKLEITKLLTAKKITHVSTCSVPGTLVKVLNATSPLVLTTTSWLGVDVMLMSQTKKLRQRG